MTKTAASFFTTAVFLLTAFSANGSVTIDLLERTLTNETSAPAFKSFSFSGSGGQATLRLINGRSGDPSIPGIDRAQIKLNGQIVIDLGDLSENLSSQNESVTIADGKNALDIISIGRSGSEFTVRITQDVDAEAAFMIGPEGGTFAVSDPGAGSFGVMLAVEKNALDKAALIRIDSVHHEQATPLFAQYREPVSALAVFKPEGLAIGSIRACFPVNSQKKGTYALYSLDDDDDKWISSTEVLQEENEGKVICGTLSRLGTYAVVNVSTCGAKGTRIFSAKADPTCREKWENSLYFALLAPQLRLLASPIYSESMTGNTSRDSLNRSQNSVLVQARELDGLNGKNLDQLWLNAEEETVELFERFFGPEFTHRWFRVMYDAMMTPAEEQTPSFDIPEEDYGVFVTFLDSLPPEEKRKRMNGLLVANEFLYQYFHQGTDETLLIEELILPPDSDMAEVMLEIAKNMGMEMNPPGIDYDIEQVSDIVSDSLSLIYRFARELTTPSASTGNATDISIRGALIGGSVNPHGMETEAWFEWGADPDMAVYEVTAPASAGTQGEERSFSGTISGLEPLSSYYFRIAASNDTGEVKGSVSSFQTPGLPPTVTHTSEEPVTSRSVVMFGSVKSNLLSTEAWFEWGSDPSLSTFDKTAIHPVDAGEGSESINHSLEGLTPDSPYYFRVAAINDAGLTRGPVVAFALPHIVVATKTAAKVTTATATLSGNLFSGKLPATAWFEWGEDPALADPSVTTPKRFEEGTAGALVEYLLEGLDMNRTYYYRLVASIGSEKVAGDTLSFTTPPAGTPASSTHLYWLAPATRVDGSKLDDLAGFKIYYGASPFSYTNAIDVRYVTRYTLRNLPPGIWYFSVTAYDSQGNESAFSNELSKEIR